MNISIEYFGQLQHIAGVKGESVELADGTDVKTLVAQLAERWGERFKDFVFGEDGQLRRSIPVVVNDRQIAYGEEVQLKDGAKVMILSPIAGG